MLLIIVLAQIATSALVSGDCDHGSMKVIDFDWNKFSDPRPWYMILHTNNNFENNFECLKFVFSSPVGNRSYIAITMYDTSVQRHTVLYGYATNWNSAGYYVIFFPIPMWSGRVYITAVDYDRYFIGKLCPFNSNKTYDYVLLRSLYLDETKEKMLLKELQDKKMIVNQLVKSRAGHCLQE